MEYVWFAVIDVVLAFSIVVTVVLYYKRLTAGIPPKRASDLDYEKTKTEEFRQVASDLERQKRGLRDELEKAYAIIKMREESAEAGAIQGQAVMANKSTPELEALRQISIGIDVLAMEQQKFRKGFDNWVRVNFGNNSGGYQDMTDDEASLREEAATLMRRYGMSYEDAMTRAKLAATYKGNGTGGAA